MLPKRSNPGFYVVSEKRRQNQSELDLYRKDKRIFVSA